MGNSQSTKKTALLISATLVGLAGVGYCAYKFMTPKTFEERLYSEISAIGITDTSNIIETDKLLKLITIVFKFSYERCKKEKDEKRHERITLLNERDHTTYVKKALEAYRLDHDCEKEILKLVLDKLNISMKIYLVSLDRNRVELQQRHCSVAMLDALNIKASLTKEQAKKLKDRMDYLTQTVNLKDYVREEDVKSEGLKTVGEKWKDVVRTIIVLDKIFLEYNLDEKEIAANLRKYGHGLT